MHTYELFEVGSDGSLHSTGKQYNFGYAIGAGNKEIVPLIFQEYKFTQYAHCYISRVSSVNSKDIEIHYSYPSPTGTEVKNTWYLKRLK